ncbi:MAG: hypothetical protein QOH81_17 [Sphingomonadales bacterium]|jgi:hypothetical protein|nr:hypothetical protein [Sphingomonadales bacterium]
MADSKPYASLSSGLLARKGGAKPAMRPQGFNTFGGNFDDLGWNDMGHVEEEAPHHVPSPVGLTPAPRSHLHVAPVEEQAPHEEAPIEEAPLEEASFEAGSFDEAPDEEPSYEAEAFDEAPDEEPTFEEAPFEEPAPVAPPAARRPIAPPPIVEQQRALRESFAEAEVVSLPRRRAAPANVKPKAAFTLRLDPDRHLKLRLASALTRLSAQQLVTGALDDFLNSLPELDALADRLPAEAGQRRS